LKKYIEEVRATDPDRVNYTIGDRTSVKIQKLLRASAILDYRTEVDEKDLKQIYYMVCMLGKDEDIERLLITIDTSIRYFKEDKELLEEVLPIVQLVQEMKFSRGEKLSISSPMMEKMLTTVKQKGGLRQKLQDISQKVLPFSQKSGRDILVQYCDAIRGLASKRETVGIIDNLEKDLNSLQYRV